MQNAEDDFLDPAAIEMLNVSMGKFQPHRIAICIFEKAVQLALARGNKESAEYIRRRLELYKAGRLPRP